jgi:hypothetical protein
VTARSSPTRRALLDVKRHPPVEAQVDAGNYAGRSPRPAPPLSTRLSGRIAEQQFGWRARVIPVAAMWRQGNGDPPAVFHTLISVTAAVSL